MKKGILIGILGAVSLAEYTRYMRAVDSLSYSASNFKLQRSGTNLLASFNMKVSNSSGKNIVLKKVTGNLSSLGRPFAFFNAPLGANIRGNTTTSIPVQAVVSGQSYLQSLVNLTDKEQQGLILNLSLNSSFDLVGIVAIPVTVRTSTKIDIIGWLSDIRALFQIWKQNRADK